MHSKFLTLLCLTTAVGLAACGGGSGSAGGGGQHSQGRPLHTFHVELSGKSLKPPGAPSGVGAAVIALHHHAVVCFRFAHLRGFTGATTAQLGEGAPGHPGKTVLELSRGRSLHHEGCVRATRALGAKLQRSGAAYYVIVNSKSYPKGAVRGQL